MILPVNGSAALVVLRCFMFGRFDIEKGAVADDATRVSVNFAPARSAKRPAWEMRLCAIEVPSQ